jgi:NhaP-type Na+/H+ or K+/H+ antiporter
VLLAIVMPATIAAVAALGYGVMGLPLGVAVLLGAVLAPTDPVLAGDVQVGPPGEPREPEPRFALTAEAGLNDGLAFPFVFLGLFIVAEEGSGWVAEWLLADVVYAVVVGVLLGAIAGRSVAALVARLRRRGWLRPELDGWLALATVFALYGLTEAVGAYGFLAAFAGGLAFRRYERHHELHGRVHAGADTVEKFAELAIVLLLGSTVTFEGLGELGLGGWIVIAALIFVVRPAVTLLAFAGSPLHRPERMFVAWFGVRGIGSFYYAAVALGAGVLPADDAATLYWTVIACTGVSIVLHGITGTPLARRVRV